ncbi:hypothetical protein OA408_01490 [Acidimicrobiaceae bacterium]|nr:hypothetical protein [Acidimicrobiaceae bacterium]
MKIKTTEFINHGVVNVGDLPIPFDMVLNASALVVVITFVYLKISWKESIVVPSKEIFEDRQNIIGKIFGAVILFFLIAPGIIGNESSKTSITPLILWVFLWIGVPTLGLIFGDVYAKFNPLNLVKISSNKPRSVYVSCFLFLGLTWFELVWREPGNPLNIASVFIILFVGVNLIRYFYKKSIIEVDPLLLLHYLYSKLKLFNSKPYFRSLINNIGNLAKLNGIEYFILLMIGTVTYDGLRETTFWYNQFGEQINNIWFSTIMFLSMNLGTIIFYRFACYFAIKVGGSELKLNEVSKLFGHTMLPIAFAYHITHYLTLLLFETQTFIYRLNDPIGTGLNLFNVQEPEINYFIEPIIIWGIQVAVTLLGHMLSVVLAHDLAVKLFGHQQSDKTQYIFLFITVALTLQALFVLSVG